MTCAFFRLLVAWLALMALTAPAAAAPEIYVALSEDGGAYAEAAAVLKAELEDARLASGAWRGLFNDKAAAPDLIVTVGVAAFDGTLDWLAAKGGAWERVPLLAVLLPRAAFDLHALQVAVGRRPMSAAVLDQPLDRQMALIRRALPERRRVGVLPGPQTQPQIQALRREAAARGLSLVAAPAIGAPAEIYPSLKVALDESDVILALPEPLVYNGGTVQNILLTTYRARVPLVAFSPAYVKAGAVLALYSTPAQVARRAAEMVRGWRAGRGLPPPQAPQEFAVTANPRVAASLGLQLDEAALIAEDLRRLEGAP
jgi:hypothetical protein